jgi:hypothetical protein
LADLQGHSITCRIASAAQRGRKALTLQSTRDASERYLLGAAVNAGAGIVPTCSGTLFQASIAL